MVLVTIAPHTLVMTAVPAYVLNKTYDSYLIDFEDYAKKQGYIGHYIAVDVDKDFCMEIKK